MHVKLVTIEATSEVLAELKDRYKVVDLFSYFVPKITTKSVCRSQENLRFIDYCIKICSDVFRVSIGDLKSKKRHRGIVDCRKAFFYLVKKNTNLTNSAIGEFFNRDHSTVIFSVKACEDLISIDKEFKNKFNKINKALQSKIKELNGR